MSRGGWIALGVIVGVSLEKLAGGLSKWNDADLTEARKRAARGNASYEQAWNRGYEEGERAGQALGRLNEQMGA